MIGKKITKVSQNSEENNSEKLQTNMTKKYLKKYIYISPEERQTIISNLRLLDY